ncbi:S-type pyocin domain-containing protein [Photobacterium leiognathi]|uniref:S-type pyocin domain-containing protein n=1 Tax=Photobacterium leiognathi TaxID=553611 RepID=UPI00273915BB|nr:S-type pyocin domain-containing protein [Photobacterium leiognathi]
MKGKIVNVDQLGFDEASRIEGDWGRFSDSELASLSLGKSVNSIRGELENGESALIVDSPSSPLLLRDGQGFSVSKSNAPLLSDSGAKKIGHRFSGNYSGGTVAKPGGSLHPAKPMPTYIPEPIVKAQSRNYEPIKISDNLSKPKINKVFAKSCTQPYGCTDACQEKESINNAFRFWGMFLGTAEAAVPIAAVAGSEVTLGVGAAQGSSSNENAAIALTKVAGNFKDNALDNLRFSVEMSPAMFFSVMLFKALQYPDETQYTEDELHTEKEVQSRIRVQITEPEEGHLYPSVHAWHVDEARIPVRYVGKGELGQYSVALEEGGPIIYWSPDESGHQVPHTTPSQDDGVAFGDIWINPISGGINNTTTAQPIPEETDWRDVVLVFPVGSGIEPLYVVFKITARNEPGVVTGQGKDVKWEDGFWLGEAANKGQGQYIPTKIADALRGREFKTFSGLQTAVWKEVAKHPDLLEQFTKSNQIEILKGNAPFVRRGYTWGETESLNRFVLHHKKEIQHGGEVYNIDNLGVVTPRLHWGEIHRKGNK